MSEAVPLEAGRQALPMDRGRSRCSRPAALTLCAVALGVRLWEIGIPSLWGDEAWTAAAASLPLPEAYQLVLGDGVHPPLYYLVLRAMAPLGLDEWMLRWPSALFGTLAVALIYRLAQTVWNDRTASLAALLAAVHPYAVWYSQEARQYSLVIALAAGVMLTFVQLRLRTKLRWLAFTAVSMLAYLTHYFLLLLPLVQFLFLVTSLRRHFARLKPWVAAQVIAAAPVALWVALYLRLPVRNLGIGWIQRPGISAVPETVWRLFFNAPLPAQWEWLGWLVAILAAWTVFRKRPAGWSSGRPLLALWLAVPILTVWLISQSRPFYSDRFFVICLPATLLILAAGLDLMTPFWAGRGLAVGLTALSVWAILQWHNPMHQKEDWRQVGQWLYLEGRPEDVIIMPDWKMPIPLRYYYKGEIPVEITVHYWGGLASLEEWARTHSRLWVIYNGRPESQPMLSNLDSFTICERRDLPGLTVFICPGSEGGAAHGRGALRAFDYAPLRRAFTMPAHL